MVRPFTLSRMQCLKLSRLNLRATLIRLQHLIRVRDLVRLIRLPCLQEWVALVRVGQAVQERTHSLVSSK